MKLREIVLAAALAGMCGLLCGCLGTPAESRETAAMGSGGAAPHYTLPELPYAYNALEPVLSEEIMRLHHGKHHAGYVRGLNNTLDALVRARAANDYAAIRALSRDLAFHGSGHALHALFWRSMTPGGAALADGALRKALERDFGSVEAFEAHFAAAARSVEGSGWALLAYEPEAGRLIVLQAENHQNLTVAGSVPLLACDVWEHAYYLQYQNRRADYVKEFLGVIDWAAVEARYAAVAAKPGS